MTKLDPITSEEVLKRQVKEQTGGSSVAASQNPIPAESSNVVPSGAAGQLTKNTRPNFRPDSEAETKQSDTDGGFLYRLPLGSYLLSFLYVQVIVIVVLSILVTLAVGMEHGHDINQALFSIRRETWGVLVISAVFSFFIFSGNNILRILTIAGSSLLAVILGYQLVSAIMTPASSATSSSILLTFFSSFMTTYVLVFTLGILLMLATIIYLLRKKVANAYN